MKRTKTFEVEYEWFEPGTKIKPYSPSIARIMGLPDKVFVVLETVEPKLPGDEAIVFIEIRGNRFGYSTESFKEVE